MKLPPIVIREMTVLASGKRFHWARMGLAGFAALACLQWLTFKNPVPGLPATGQQSFQMLSWLGLILALGAAIVTADSVSYERREGTLGLLFLTTMKSHDIVLGKLSALGIVALYTLLGFAPVLMVPIIHGGLVGSEIARVVLVLLNLMFVSLATGLFVSVFARNQFGAILKAFALLGFLCLAPFFIDVVTQSTLKVPFALFSPVASFFVSGGPIYSASPTAFWVALAVAHAEGWLLIAAASFALGQNWRKAYKPDSTPREPPQSRRLMGSPRVLMGIRENRKRAFAPVARAMLRMPGLSELAWFAAVISFTGSILNGFVMNHVGSVWISASVSVVFTFVSSSLFAFAGGRFLFDARRSGELELLLVTPIGAKGILREQRLALLRVLRGPISLVVIGAIIVAVGALRENESRELIGLLLGLCQVANAALGVLAVAWLGMWFGSRANNVFSMIGFTVGLVEVLPIVLAYGLPLLFLGATGMEELWPLIVPVVFVIKNIFFIKWAGARLRSEFRTKDRFKSDTVVQRILRAFVGRPRDVQPEVAS